MNSKEKRIWTRIFGVYKHSPHLWNKQNSHYMNKSLRQKSFRVLLDIYREFDENASIHTFKNKLLNMRTAFFREWKKVQNGKQMKNNKEATSPHGPSLWYYDLLLFLIEPEESKRNFKDTLDESLDVTQLTPNKKKKSDGNENTRKQSLRNESTDKRFLQIPQQVTNQQNGAEQTDEFDSFGRMMATELRKLKHPYQPIAQKLMYDVLFYAKMGRLNEDTSIKIPPSPFSTEKDYVLDITDLDDCDSD